MIVDCGSHIKMCKLLGACRCSISLNGPYHSFRNGLHAWLPGSTPVASDVQWGPRQPLSASRELPHLCPSDVAQKQRGSHPINRTRQSARPFGRSPPSGDPTAACVGRLVVGVRWGEVSDVPRVGFWRHRSASIAATGARL